MKRSCLIISVCFFYFYVNGQDKKTRDIGITIGGPTSNDLFDITNQVIVSGASLGNFTYSNQNSKPSIVLNYKSAIKNKWFVYADGAYQSIEEDALVNGQKVGDVNNMFITLGLGTEYHYLSREFIQVYSGLSIGYTFQNSNFTGSSTDFNDGRSSFANFQINALGFRVGKKLAAVAELGAGYKGILNLGLSYQF